MTAPSATPPVPSVASTSTTPGLKQLKIDRGGNVAGKKRPWMRWVIIAIVLLLVAGFMAFWIIRVVLAADIDKVIAEQRFE